MLIHKFIANQCHFAHSFWYSTIQYIHLSILYPLYNSNIETFILILSCKRLSSHNINIHTYINNIFLSTH